MLRNSIGIIEVGAGMAVPTIRRLGEQFLTDEIKYKTTLVRINMKDFECNAFAKFEQINENNIDTFPEANESKEEFLKNLNKRKESDKNQNIKQLPLVIDIKASGLEGIKLIYEAIKEYSPTSF